MRVAATILAVAAALALTLVSLPWILYGMGRGMLGDQIGFDAAMGASPIFRYLDWLERREA